MPRARPRMQWIVSWFHRRCASLEEHVGIALECLGEIADGLRGFAKVAERVLELSDRSVRVLAEVAEGVRRSGRARDKSLVAVDPIENLVHLGDGDVQIVDRLRGALRHAGLVEVLED